MPSTIVDLFRGALFALAHWCGGSFGAAIVVAGVALRVLLLPVSLRAARRRAVRESQLRALAPELEALKRRHAGRPDRIALATQQLYEQRGIALVDRGLLVDSLLLFPPAAALYAAIRAIPRGVGRFLWMTDLVTPDRALATVAALASAAIAWAASTSGDSARAAQLAPLIGAIVTFVILSHISAGVALYSLTTSVIGGAEQMLVRRRIAREAA